MGRLWFHRLMDSASGVAALGGCRTAITFQTTSNTHQAESMKMNHQRLGTGKPLLLIHGLGGSARSWSTIWTALAERREVIAVDLPGFGGTPQLAGETSIRSLCDAVTAF